MGSNHASRLDHTFSIDSDPISTQKIIILLTRIWNQIHHCGGWRRTRSLHRSRLRLDRLNPKLMNRIFMLPNNIDLCTANTHREVVGRVHSIYTLRLPHYLESACIVNSPSFMLVTTVILETAPGWNIICRSALPLDWPRQVFLYYKFLPMRDANKNHLQILSSVIFCIPYEFAVQRNIFLATDCLGVKIFSSTRFMNRHFNSFRSIGRELELLESKYCFLEASNGPTLKGLEFREDKCRALTTDIQEDGIVSWYNAPYCRIWYVRHPTLLHVSSSQKGGRTIGPHL